jgi:glucose dehydrogenase
MSEFFLVFCLILRRKNDEFEKNWNIIRVVVAVGVGRVLGRKQPPPQKTSSQVINTARIMAANLEPRNWFTTGRTFGKTHYSPLTQINKETVSTLCFAWDYKIATARGLESTSVVVDGKMYTSGKWGRAFTATFTV